MPSLFPCGTDLGHKTVLLKYSMDTDLLRHLGPSLLKAIRVYWLQHVLCQIPCGWHEFTDTMIRCKYTAEKAVGWNLDFGRERMQTGLNSGLTAQTIKDTAAPLHCTGFSQGKGDLLQGRWLGVEGAVIGTVSIQGCFPEECIPNSGWVCRNVSCTKGLNTAHFEYGDIFIHLFFCLCPLRSQVSGVSVF